MAVVAAAKGRPVVSPEEGAADAGFRALTSQRCSDRFARARAVPPPKRHQATDRMKEGIP